MSTTPISQIGLSLRELLTGAVFGDGRDIRVSSCCSDPRSCHPGDVFVAMVSADADGHDQVHDAVARGAVAIVAERVLPPVGVPVCVVPDSRQAYGQICHALAGNPSRQLKVIGITGAHGKTSVSCLVAGMLETAGHAVGLLNSLGYCDGTGYETPLWECPPAPVLAHWLARMRDNGCTHAVIEINESALAQSQLAGVELNVAVVINEHTPGSKKRRGPSAALRLLDHLSPTGMAVINVDDPAGSELVEKLECPTLTTSLFDEAEITGTVIDRCRSEQTLLLTAGADAVPVRTAMVGDGHAQNCLLGAAIGLGLGLNLESVVRGLESVKRIPGRLERVECGQPFGVFVDEAMTAERLTQALETLRPLTDGQLICVVDVGGRTAAAEQQVAATVSKLADVIVATPTAGGATRQVQERFLTNCSQPQAVRTVGDRSLAIQWALNEAHAGDCVLITGGAQEAVRSLAQGGDLDGREVVRQWLYDHGVLISLTSRKSAA